MQKIPFFFRGWFWLLLAALGAGGILVGCTRLPPGAQDTKNTVINVQAEEGPEAALQALDKGADLAVWRGIVGQLNSYLERHPDRKPKLTPGEKKLLESRLELAEGDLASVGSGKFDFIDEYHLDQCWTLGEAARSLDVATLPEPDRAAAGFAWVVRQVRLNDYARTAPPHYILRRGFGTAAQRTLVFLALLDQLGLQGCVVKVGPGMPTPPNNPQEPTIRSPLDSFRLVGVVAGKDIYLFDPCLGMPLPNPEGPGIATLAQLRSQPEKVLAPLSIGTDYVYDISADDARTAAARPAVFLASLSPRMRFLQELLAAHHGIHLHAERALQPDANLGEGKWVVVRELDAQFPPIMGGTHPAANLDLDFNHSVVPWDNLPKAAHEMTGKTGEYIQSLYSQPFVRMASAPPTAQETASMSRENKFAALCPNCRTQFMVSERSEGQEEKCPRCSRTFTIEGRKPLETRQETLARFSDAPWGARDRLIRGRADEATTRFSEVLERAREITQMNIPTEAEFAQWCAKLDAIEGTLRSAQRAKDAQAATTAQKALDAAWMQGQKERLVLIVFARAAQKMAGEAAFNLALLKHEKAEQLQARLERKDDRPADVTTEVVRDAWKSAADWWRKYLDQRPSEPAEAPARQLQARALAAAGDRDAAIQVLELVPVSANKWDRHASAYLKEQLKKSK